MFEVDKFSGELNVWDYMVMMERAKEMEKTPDQRYRDKAIREYNGKPTLRDHIRWFFGL